MKLSPWSLERDIATFAYLILSAKGTAKIPGTATAAQTISMDDRRRVILMHGAQYGKKKRVYRFTRLDPILTKKTSLCRTERR
jgi:hypothetical protein